MRANMPPTGHRQVNEKPFKIAINSRESAPFYPLDLQKTQNSFGLVRRAVETRPGAGLVLLRTPGEAQYPVARLGRCPHRMLLTVCFSAIQAPTPKLRGN